MFKVRAATRQRRPLKISLEGLSGSGKTFTGLRLLFAMQAAGIGNRIAVADSENSSSELYSGIVIDGRKWDFDVLDLTAEHQNPNGYAAAYDYLCKQGYDLILMDSLSHAWYGALERVEAIAKRGGRNDKFAGWAEVTPEQRNMLTTLTDGRANLVTTMRVKSEYDLVERNGKQVRQKIGLKTDQRDNTEYEFDMVLRLDQDHRATVEKVRGCTAMDGKSVLAPGPEFFQPLFDWWKSAPPEPQAPRIDVPKLAPPPQTLPPRPDREPGDDLSDTTQVSIEAALRILKREWNADTIALASRAVGHLLPDDVTIDGLTQGEGEKIVAALNKAITKRAQQPTKGGTV